MIPKISYYIVNGITLWRVIMAPIVICLAFLHMEELFKWLLTLSFLTDAIDGLLARKYHVTSKKGSRLDSLGDDLTVLSAFIGMLVFKMDFVRLHQLILLILAGLWLLQLVLALIRYHRPTSFHTWMAKGAAILQGSFLLLLFFLPSPPLVLFYIAAAATGLDLVEEIIMVILLREWKADVKGLYNIYRSGRSA
ncbi:MAG TPA: CDP-alcohol phosphatidyltransferase family protein [Puia sp.]|nr:CDP-alcohol phosphatidyltransferase family protein [Puia sp.]